MAGRRLRAPQQDGAVFAEPPLDEFQVRLALRSGAETGALCGRSLAELRRLGRETAVEAAQAYLQAAGQPVPPCPGTHLLAAGHQPEIFHPGVWVKNFALCGLAAATGLAPLNFIVDNDIVKATALSMPSWPAGKEQQPNAYRLEKVAFDAWPGNVPYEECQVSDETLFASLPQRARAISQSWGFTPLLPAYWREVIQHRERTPFLGERLTAGRRALERQWGCANLEVPVSRLCETEPFAWFVAHLCNDLERFHEVYNDIVRAYRRDHGMRSRNHPVPDLASDGPWREVPLWAWRQGARRRGRLFLRPTAEALELRVDGEAWPKLPLAAPAFVEAWRNLHRDGFKLRSRALTTTLYNRLMVADSFIHGIGGAKYDELTDELLRRFYGIEPPGFLVLSATLLLPFQGFSATKDRCRQLAQDLRDLRWNPQRHLEPPLDGRAVELVAAREALLSRDGLPLGGRERYYELRRITEELQPFVRQSFERTQDAVHRCEQELRTNTVLRRRDYGFCLYLEAQLRPFCTRFLQLEMK
jgi:hypothetical protein